MLDWQEKYYADIDLHVRVRKNSEVSVKYEVRRLFGKGTDGVLLFQKPKDNGRVPTENVEEGGLLIHGDIKWDGCSHNYFGAPNGYTEEGYVHACSREELTNWATLYNRLFDWAIELLGEDTKEFLEPL